MVGFVFIGPILLALQGIFAWIAQTPVASDFVAQAGAGGDIYTLLDDLAEDSVAFDIAQNLLFPALLGLIVVMVYVPLQAMRAGLLTRFFATLGMALGASALFIVPAISLLALMLWFGWLGLTILDKLRKGRPPAWDAGVAMPWPKPGEQAQPVPAAAGGPDVVEGDATEVFEPDDSPRSQRPSRARQEEEAQAPAVSTRDGFRFGEALPSAQEAERLLRCVDPPGAGGAGAKRGAGRARSRG